MKWSRPTDRSGFAFGAVSEQDLRNADLFYADLIGLPGGGTAEDASPSESLFGETLPPAPLSQAASGNPIPFDRSRVTITGLPTEALASTVGGVLIFAPIMVTPAFSDPQVNHREFELYDPNAKYLGGNATFRTSPNATTLTYAIDSSRFKAGQVVQGRYLVRLVGIKDAERYVYSDASFWIWSAAPVSLQLLPALAAIKAAPASSSLGTVGAAYARSMMLEHQAAVDATGVGTVQGNQCGTAPPQGSNPAKHDCTTYVLEILKNAFNAKGKGADWTVVFQEAQRLSGGSFKGTSLLAALVSKAGWKAVFWSPDPRSPRDGLSEHPVAFKDVQKKGTYYGIPVEKAQSVIDYVPTSPTKQETMDQLDKLRMVPFGVIAAKGGMHMTALLHANVYEVHYTLPVTDRNVVQATPLERWAWLSGVVVMPPDDFQSAFNP
jgi:hypothetical protein